MIQGIGLVVVVLAKERGASSPQIEMSLGIGSVAGLAGSFTVPRVGRLRVTPKMAVMGLGFLLQRAGQTATPLILGAVTTVVAALALLDRTPAAADENAPDGAPSSVAGAN